MLVLSETKLQGCSKSTLAVIKGSVFPFDFFPCEYSEELAPMVISKCSVCCIDVDGCTQDGECYQELIKLFLGIEKKYLYASGDITKKFCQDRELGHW